MGQSDETVYWVRIKPRYGFTYHSGLFHRKASTILKGRQSFPSGHSSTAFAGMVFLSLWTAGQTAALCPSVIPSVKWLPSRMATFLLTLVPLFWAIHVAVTRVEDYVRDILS